jgi:hypothetical protein
MRLNVSRKLRNRNGTGIHGPYLVPLFTETSVKMCGKVRVGWQLQIGSGLEATATSGPFADGKTEISILYVSCNER